MMQLPVPIFLHECSLLCHLNYDFRQMCKLFFLFTCAITLFLIVNTNGKSAMLMSGSEVRQGRLVEDNRKATATQISISEPAAFPALKQCISVDTQAMSVRKCSEVFPFTMNCSICFSWKPLKKILVWQCTNVSTPRLFCRFLTLHFMLRQLPLLKRKLDSNTHFPIRTLRHKNSRVATPNQSDSKRPARLKCPSQNSCGSEK